MRVVCKGLQQVFLHVGYFSTAVVCSLLPARAAVHTCQLAHERHWFHALASYAMSVLGALNASTEHGACVLHWFGAVLNGHWSLFHNAKQRALSVALVPCRTSCRKWIFTLVQCGIRPCIDGCLVFRCGLSLRLSLVMTVPFTVLPPGIWLLVVTQVHLSWFRVQAARISDTASPWHPPFCREKGPYITQHVRQHDRSAATG
jgi:hypothetical protein